MKVMAQVFGLALLYCALIACSKPSSDRDWPKPNSQTPKEYNDTSEECRDFVDALPSDWVRGFITVNENANDPKSPQLRIFYYGRWLEGQTPTLFINGGPTSDSHGDYRVMTNTGLAAAAWSHAPILFFDQRGNGCSSKYPQGNSSEILARLKYYGSTAIVNDAEAIRKSLFGDKPWSIFGQSYGAWVVHRYVTLYPYSVKNAFAHANAITVEPIQRLADRVMAQNRVLNTYFGQYPDDQKRLETLRRFLTPSTCYPILAKSNQRCGYGAIQTLVTRMAFVPRWPWIHSWLKTIVVINDNSITYDPNAMSDFVRKNAFSQVVDSSNNKYWAQLIIDRYDRDVPSFDRHTCESIYDILRSRGEQPESYLLHECMTAMQYSADENFLKDRDLRLKAFEAANGNDHLTIDSFRSALLQKAQTFFYLYAGLLDNMVPVENFEYEISKVSALVHYRRFATSGHDGFYTEPQIARDVLGLSILK